MSTGPWYTEDDLKRAWRLRGQKLTWGQIASRMGRSEAALTITAHRYRKGTWAPGRQSEKSAARAAQIEALVGAGATKLSEIAPILGITEVGAHRRLMRMGLDAEMRRQIAAEGRTR